MPTKSVTMKLTYNHTLNVSNKMDYLWISNTSRDWGEADLRLLIVPIILRYM